MGVPSRPRARGCLERRELREPFAREQGRNGVGARVALARAGGGDFDSVVG